MATYASLSDSDRAVVDNIVNMVRASAGERARAWNRQKSIADDTNAVALLVSIEPSDTIPNTSGLAGADDMTRSELVDVWSLLELDRIANDNVTNRAAMSKAAGINAMIS